MYHLTLEGGFKLWQWVPDRGIFLKVNLWRNQAFIDPYMYGDYDWIRAHTRYKHRDLDELLSWAVMEAL